MDLAEPRVLDRKTWRWFTARLFGLSLESRTWRRLLGEQREQTEEASTDEVDAAFGVERE